MRTPTLRMGPIVIVVIGALSLTAGLIAGARRWGHSTPSQQFPYFGSPPTGLLIVSIVLGAIVTGTIITLGTGRMLWLKREAPAVRILFPLAAVVSATVGIQQALTLSTPMTNPIPVLDWLLFTIPFAVGVNIPSRPTGEASRIGQGVLLTYPMLSEYALGWQQYDHSAELSLSLVIPVFTIGLLFGLPFTLIPLRGKAVSHHEGMLT